MVINMKDINKKEIIEDITFYTYKEFGTAVKDMVLFGSYARGDYTEESDIDIAVILNVSRPDLEKYYSDAAMIMSDVSLKYDILVSFSLIPYDEFNIYKDSMPFYRNIANEGVVIGAS